MPAAFKKSIILFILVAAVLGGYFFLGPKEKDGLIDREVQFALELVPLLYDQVPWARSRPHLESVSQRETDRFVESWERIEQKLMLSEKEAIAITLADVTPEMSIFELGEVFHKRKDDHFPISMTKAGRSIYSNFVVNRLIKAVIDKGPIHDAQRAADQGKFDLINLTYKINDIKVTPKFYKTVTPSVTCTGPFKYTTIKYEFDVITLRYFLDHEFDLHRAFLEYLSQYNRHLFHEPSFPFKENCSLVEGP